MKHGQKVIWQPEECFISSHKHLIINNFVIGKDVFILFVLDYPCLLPKLSYFSNPMEREFEIHKYLNVALNAIGDVKGALESVNFGLQSQTDPMLLGNKALYEKHFAIQQISSSLDTLKNNKSIDDKAAEIVLSIVNNMVPTNYLLNQKIADVVSMPNGKYDIVFFIGQGVEEWTPETIKQRNWWQ